MSVEPRNVGNKKALGLFSQCCECGWTRLLEEESGAREDGSGSADKAYAGETTRNLAPLDQTARGRVFPIIFKLFGVD